MDARGVFADRSIFVKLRPEGFEFRGEVSEALEASALDRPEPVRKLFEGGALVCYAPDGEVSRTGRRCGECPDRARCQPRLRLRGLARGEHPFILELAPRSALRFLDFLDRLDRSGQALCRTVVVLRALRTAGYPEVGAEVSGDGAPEAALGAASVVAPT